MRFQKAVTRYITINLLKIFLKQDYTIYNILTRYNSNSLYYLFNSELNLWVLNNSFKFIFLKNKIKQIRKTTKKAEENVRYMDYI